MIKTLNAGKHLEVSNGYASYPYIDAHHGQPIVGMVRYNNNNLEAYDGTTWHKLGEAYPTVSLTKSATAAIDWAMKEMDFEAKLEQLGSDHPAVKAAHENFRRAAEQLKATIILSQDE